MRLRVLSCDAASSDSAEWLNIGRRRVGLIAVFRPIGHEQSPLVEQVATPVGSFGLVANRMSERHLADFMGVSGALGRPVPERGTEPVHGDVGLHPSQKHRHCHERELAAVTGK